MTKSQLAIPAVMRSSSLFEASSQTWRMPEDVPVTMVLLSGCQAADSTLPSVRGKVLAY